MTISINDTSPLSARSDVSDTRSMPAPTAAKALPPASVADELYRQISVLYRESRGEDSSRLDRLIEVGHKLQRVEALLGCHDFEKAFAGRKIEFSLSSARCYLRFARYADAIRAAGLTRVKQANELARQLEYAQYRKASELAAAATSSAKALAAEHESRVFNDMRRLPATDQPAFMADILGRLTRLQGLFA